MSSNAIQLPMEASIKEIAAAMTLGQQVHMANHLWKHYKVLASKGRHVEVDGKEYILIPVEG